MKLTNNKLEQAEHIAKHGCSDLNCLTCQFINGICRIYKPDTDPKVLKEVNQFLRKEKLKILK